MLFLLLLQMRMPIYLIAKTSHTVMNMCCFGYTISVTVLLVLLVVIMIITCHCLGFNKNILSCLQSLLQSLRSVTDQRQGTLTKHLPKGLLSCSGAFDCITHLSCKCKCQICFLSTFRTSSCFLGKE